MNFRREDGWQLFFRYCNTENNVLQLRRIHHNKKNNHKLGAKRYSVRLHNVANTI